MLVDMYINIEAVRVMFYLICRMIDSGVKDFLKEFLVCKVFVFDVVMKVIIDVV